MRIISKSATLFKNKAGVFIIKVVFPFNSKELERIKSIRGREWVKKEKYWTIPLTLENCIILKRAKYLLSDSIENWAEEVWELEERLKKPLKLRKFNADLRLYQEEGVKGIMRFSGRALLADDMGLGKTIQALAWLHIKKRLRPAIVVCPSSLKINWFKEATKFMNNPIVQILETTTPSTLYGRILVINYEILWAWVDVLIQYGVKACIMDEIHYIKTPNAKRSIAAETLCNTLDYVIGLSGTPIEKGVADLYNPIRIINNSIFPDIWKFKWRYCGPKKGYKGYEFKGASNVKELHEILISTVMIRRRKADVLTELPDKIYSFIPLEIDNRAEYKKAESNFIEYVKKNIQISARKLIAEIFAYNEDAPIKIDDNKLTRLQEEQATKASPLAQIETLKQIAVRGKLKAVIAWIDDFLESGEKLVVFCEHIFIIEELMQHYKKVAVKIDGSVTMKKRDLAVEAFQKSNKIRLFIGNKAAEVGLTLTAASNVAIVEYPWLPGPLAQRIDRVHRIGQHYVVGVYYLMAVGTVEETIAKNLDKAQRIIDSVIDGKETDEENLLGNLINEFKNRAL